MPQTQDMKVLEVLQAQLIVFFVGLPRLLQWDQKSSLPLTGPCANSEAMQTGPLVEG